MIEMRVLGSGSSGNCTLVRVGDRLVMIDAGLGPRTVARRLGPEEAGELDRLDALLLTHLDRDHFNPAWFAPLAQRGVSIYCHEKHLYGLYRHRPTTRQQIDARAMHRQGLLRPFKTNPFTIDAIGGGDPAVRAHPLPLLHDRSGVFAFYLEAGPSRLGYATDLGRVSGRLIEAFCDVDLLAIESNYDVPMQQASPRPMTLKHRIMGGRGHLSNDQAFDAVRRIVQNSTRPPAHIVLLHLSRQCNEPRLIRDLYAPHPDLADRLCLTHHKQPTRWLHADGTGRVRQRARPVAPQQQMTMF